MGDIKPTEPGLLTDEDVDYSHFHCCGDEDLVFLRCQHCEHIWVECYECSTWYIDLADLSKQASSFMTSKGERLSCPNCGVRFAHRTYFIDQYFATAEQVVAAGAGRFLSEAQRKRLGCE